MLDMVGSHNKLGVCFMLRRVGTSSFGVMFGLLVSVAPLASQTAEDAGAAERAAAVEDAMAAFEALAAETQAQADAAEAEARAAAVAQAQDAFAELAAESATRREEAAAAERADALAQAQAAFADLAAETEARREAERQASVAAVQAAFAAMAEARAAEAERLAAVAAVQEAFAARAAERAAAQEAERLAAVAAVQEAFAARAAERAAAQQEAERLAAVAAVQEAFAARAAERAAAQQEAERLAAVAAVQEAFAARAAERAAAQEAERLAAVAAVQEAFAARAAARAAAEAALSECIATAGVPSAEVPISEAAQAQAFAALRDALPACRAAAEALPDEGAPFYHLATAAQAAGRHRRAVPLYEQAAENGVAAALTRLGDYYNFGIRPIREDAEAAVDFYRQAAQAGDVAGTATLSFMYRLGRGVPRDPAEMVRLMQAAADQGYPFAQFNLGRTYLSGEGIPGGADAALGIPDARRAVPLLAAAARAGNIEAAEDLIALYDQGGAGVAASPFLRFRWTNFLAEQGNLDYQAQRAFLYEQGIGRDRDPQFAAEEYIRLLQTGELELNDLRGEVDGRVPPWDGDTARAFQTILQDLGLYALAIDGDVGPGTRAAAQALIEQSRN